MYPLSVQDRMCIQRTVIMTVNFIGHIIFLKENLRLSVVVVFKNVQLSKGDQLKALPGKEDSAKRRLKERNQCYLVAPFVI